MAPFLLSGDIVYLKKIPFSKIHVNDLICFKNGAKFTTHRVIHKPITGKFLITKGDNNFYADKKTYPKHITGKIVKIKRQDKIFSPEQAYLFQSTFYFKEILNLTQVFEKENINFLILKGLPLHLFFEKTHPKRIYADCDLLITPIQFNLVKKSLTELGFKQVNSSFSKAHSFLKDKETEITFSKIINNFQIIFDVHFEITFLMHQLGKMDLLYPQELIDSLTEEFLKNKTKEKIQNYFFPILKLENLVLYLSLHLFHHNFRGYYRYQLIDLILQTNKIDFDKLAGQIYKYKLRSFVYPVFKLLKKYYSTPIPEVFINKIKPDNSKIEYISKNILKINIFDEEFRIRAGIDRFLFIFHLSPNPIYQKVLIFLNIQILYSIFWVLFQKIKIWKRQ